MIRVLQIGMTDNVGGIENYLINYYRNINKSKVQFDFINIYDNDLCFKKEIISSGGNIYNISSYYKNPFKYIHELISIIKKNNYEIVHCNMNSAVMIYPLIAAKLANVNVIIAHAHNASSDKGIIKSILHNINRVFVPLLANKYFACSDKAGEWFFSKKIIQSNNYYVIKNAIDTSKFKFNLEVRKLKREKLQISNDSFVIGHVGRFNKQKNHEYIIEIFKYINSYVKKSKLILVGSGPLLSKIKSKVLAYNLQNDVIFLGERNDVNELMMAFDVFLLPSLYEGLPLVGIEAQSSGLKCYWSDNITKTINLLETNQFISLNKSPEEWANIICSGKTNTSDFRTNAYIKIKKSGFCIKDEAKKLTELYEKFILDDSLQKRRKN